MFSRSLANTRFSRSLHVSLMAVSGAILITFVPLPRKNARAVPAHMCQAAFRLLWNKQYLSNVSLNTARLPVCHGGPMAPAIINIEHRAHG